MPLDMTSSDTYDSPDSSPDPYATSPSTENELRPYIKLSSLPSGLPILGPLTGYTSARKAAHIQGRFAQIQESIRRPLTETEQVAIAYHTAKGFAVSSYGPALGFGAGLYRTYATRAEFRWPMYGKLISDPPAEGEVQKGFWDGQKMRAGGREIFPGLSSQFQARILHLARGFAYCLGAWFFVPLVVSSYAATVTTVGELRDPRLQEATRELREAVSRGLTQRREQVGDIVKQTEARREGRMPSLPRERDQGWTRRGKGAEVDDASPTGGLGPDMATDDELARSREAGDMYGVLSDGQTRTAEAKAQPQPSQRPASKRSATFQTEKVDRQPKDFGSDFDDASPTGGSGAMGGGDGSGGSVWERIRQQSASSPTNSSTGRRSGARGSGSGMQQEDSTTGESFSFSSSDGERSYAQTEAQKEFDERVERERRGGDFSSDGRRRW